MTRFTSVYTKYLIQSQAFCLLHAGFLFCLIFNPEDGADILLRNTGWLSADYTTLYPEDRTVRNDRCENLTLYM
jgi:hypothetical protein